jgi:CheY-like chemotaxis protein
MQPPGFRDCVDPHALNVERQIVVMANDSFDRMWRPMTSIGAAMSINSKRLVHRVLLVEDHAALAEATAELIRHHGLEVRVATTGADAVKIAEEFNPVLVLCDMMLPDMAGLDVAQVLRANDRTNDLLIVMLTARSADDLREFKGHTGTRVVNLFLSKPLTEETLTELLSNLEVLQSQQEVPPGFFAMRTLNRRT